MTAAAGTTADRVVPRRVVGLLETVVRDAVDPSYAEAARRSRDHTGGDDHRRGHTMAGVVMLVAVSVVIGLTVSSQHRTLPQVGAARSALAGDAGTRTLQLHRLEQTVAALKSQIAALSRQVARRQPSATAAGRDALHQVAVLSGAVGETAARGPGTVVTVSDASDGSAGGGFAGSRPQGQTAQRTGKVSDADLQSVVNAMWANGAEAIAINGVRLGPQTAIRTAGETILVAFHPVTSPYRVVAIGRPALTAAVQQSSALTALLKGPTGTHPGVTVNPSAMLTLAAAAPVRTGSARVLGGHS